MEFHIGIGIIVMLCMIGLSIFAYNIGRYQAFCAVRQIYAEESADRFRKYSDLLRERVALRDRIEFDNQEIKRLQAELRDMADLTEHYRDEYRSACGSDPSDKL